MLVNYILIVVESPYIRFGLLDRLLLFALNLCMFEHLIALHHFLGSNK